MKYKYFSEEAVKAVLDPSKKAEETVRIVMDCIENNVGDLTDEQKREMQLEAKQLQGEIQKMLSKTQAYDRQNKLHRLYLDTKIKAAAEDFMLALTTCNNAAYIVMKDAIDQVRQLPEYGARCSMMRKRFNNAEREWQMYEQRLKQSDEGWFDPRRFSDQQRKRYAADLERDDFFDYWQCIGGKSYHKILDEVNVLRNKFLLSVQSHGLPHPKASAYVLAAASMLMLCEAVYTKTVQRLAVNYSIKPAEAHERMKDFSLKKMMLAWGQCVKMMGPVTMLSQMDSRNIEMTLEQLVDHWNDFSFFITSVIETTEDFPEIFRTQGEQKKYLRELNEKLKD